MEKTGKGKLKGKKWVGEEREWTGVSHNWH